MIYLVIAREGDYSDKKTWVVKAFTNEAAAVEEAARLNAAIPIAEQLSRDYYIKWRERIDELQRKYPSALHYEQVTSDLGPSPETADDYTVVAVPINESGKWELP